MNPAKAYLSIPTRPTAEKDIQPPAENIVNRTYQIFSKALGHVEYLIGYEGNAFSFTGNVVEDILSISAVHPIREDAMAILLENASADWLIIDLLIQQQKLIETEYKGYKFYLRKFTS